jgi:hypothetical protein
VIKYDNSYIGRKYGRLTVIGFGKEHRFVCKCECGTVKEIVSKNVVDGTIVSCGCYAKEVRSINSIKHGDSQKSSKYHRIYKIYQGMIRRCYQPNSDRYYRYGARGITICKEWLDDYVNFRTWALSHGYSDSLTIDRINNDGNYEPSNCRWATNEQQANNKSKYYQKHKPKKSWTIGSITKSIDDWCSEYGLSVPMVMYRVKTKGMTPFEALTTNKLTKGRPMKVGD